MELQAEEELKFVVTPITLNLVEQLVMVQIIERDLVPKIFNFEVIFVL